MRVDLSSRSYSFAFVPNVKGFVSAADLHENCESYLQNLCGEAADFTKLDQSHPSGLTRYVLMRDFPSLFHLPLAMPSVAAMTSICAILLRFRRSRVGVCPKSFLGLVHPSLSILARVPVRRLCGSGSEDLTTNHPRTNYFVVRHFAEDWFVC